MGSRKSRILASVLFVSVLVAALSGAVYAYLSASPGSVDNNFTAAPTHTIEIEETFPTGDTNPIKKNVKVNVGKPGYAVYVRAAIVVTWQNDAGQVYGMAPKEGTDFNLTLNGADWIKGSDGFYYLETMFIGSDANGGLTPVLITQCEQSAAAPESGYTLHVEIIAQTIQAKGSTDADGTPAVTDAWGVKVNGNGELVVPTT